MRLFGIAPYLPRPSVESVVKTTTAFALKPQGNETSEHPGAVQNSHRTLPKPQ